ncbi:type VI secretion system baseplate subunit TssK [Candidatus Nucleicultrix amoebiphila]|uniref:Type VI secretion protein n=1 Tax=Candidatus Nucleicultrix amoebiphila FS5 TaxID=1414854 RepID=A0A1W6N5P1_9PROT|nr:type VI secretion system baseplate subunit TssK [Candidatus Nucleicultrix amoebiphila]ARN85184.1 hypothetical protein GQ61_07695 [Candidatus Nucleicultrix amoebiphila FS5]
MADVQRIQRPIQWYEGMLLLPEHFQQGDRRFEQMIHYHVNNIKPFYWGVIKSKIDEGLLVVGTLKFLELEAVFPDGLVVSFTIDDNVDLSIDLSQFAPSIQNKPQTIYLCVPEYRSGAANTKGKLSRYRSVVSPAYADENTGLGEVTFPLLEPNICLLVSDAPPNHYSSFPIATVTMEENTYMFTDFLPPQLKTSLDSDLGALLLDVTKRIRSKIGFLGERIRSRSLGVLSNDADSAMRSLNSGILPFEALLNTNLAHPFDLYCALNIIAGHFVNVVSGQMPPTFQPFNYNDLRSSFMEVIDFIHSMLDRIQEGYTVVEFTQKDRLFMLKLDQTWMSNRLVLGAKTPPTMTEKQLVEWINSAVIASDRFVESVRDRRTLGVTRKIITGDEEMSLLPAKDVVLFEVENNPDFIDANENLLIFNISDSIETRPVEVVMFIPKHRRESFF